MSVIRKAAKAGRALRSEGGRAALFSERVVASYELEGLLAGVVPRCVLDVGANRGQFTLLARELWAARVTAFEPLAAAADVFQRVHGRDPLVDLRRVAIGGEPGSATLHVSNRDDSSSLLAIGEGQVGAYPETREVATTTVEVVTLGSQLGSLVDAGPTLMKIDVQGYELEVLRGAEDVLRGIDWIVVELSFDELYEGQPLADEVLGWLNQRGWRLARARTSDARVGGRPVQVDCLLEKRV